MCPLVFLFLTLWLQMTALDNITCQLSQEKWHFQEDHNSHNKDDKFHRSLQQKGVQVLFQDRVLYILREKSLKFSKKWQNKKWNTLKTILMLFVSIATVKWWYRCLEVFLLTILHFWEYIGKLKIWGKVKIKGCLCSQNRRKQISSL